jgi:uroporphyrinogen III methyltransferase/synthase
MVVPGVTAASAAAAGAGIPLTDRRCASWLTIATGRKASSPSLAVPWRQLGSLSGGTLTVYMGLLAVKDVVRHLISGGMSPDTPAAAVSNAFCGGQTVLLARLADLPKKITDSRVTRPALIIIGQTAALSARLNWWRTGPLTGQTVLVTRPAGRLDEMCKLIREYDGQPIPMPTIAVSPVDDQNEWRRFEEFLGSTGAVKPGETPVRRAGSGKRPSGENWLVFTSVAGAEYFIQFLLRRGWDLRALGGLKIAAIGPGTAEGLLRWGVRPDLMPASSTTRALSRSLSQTVVPRSVVVRVRGDRSEDSLECAVASVGGKPLPLTVYQTLTATWDDHLKNIVAESPPNWLTFTSGSSVQGFVEILGPNAARRLSERSLVAVIGPETAGTARKYGIAPAVTAREHTVKGLIRAIAKYK